MTNIFEKQDQYFAFNIWDVDSIWAVAEAAAASHCDVILQTSSRVFETIDGKLIRECVDRCWERLGVRGYLTLDHCRNMNVIRQAVDLGWDSVMFDGSDLPLERNIQLTNQACSYAHAHGVLVEAEVGQIHGVEDDIHIAHESVARIEDVYTFLQDTDADWIAAAIGTSHGLYRAAPKIRYDILEQILALTQKPFVVHGGSGLTKRELERLLSYDGVRKINISTEIKQAYRAGILSAMQKGLLESEGFEVAPIKIEIARAICATVTEKMRLLCKQMC